MSADAIAVYEGLDVLAAKPATDRLEHRLISFVPIEEEFSAGRFAELRACRDRRAARRGPDADRGRGHRPLPARRADRARPAPARGAGPARGPGARARRGGPGNAARPPLAADRGLGAPERPQAHRARAGARAGRHGPAPCLRSAVVRGAAAPDGAVRHRHGSRRARGPGSRPGSARCSPAARSRRSSAPSSGVLRAPRARRSGSRRSPPTSPVRRAWMTCASGSSAGTAHTCAASSPGCASSSGVETIDRTNLSARDVAQRILA